MGTITDFITEIKGEVARPKLFDVVINVPSGLQAFFNTKKQYLEPEIARLKYKAESTNIPGRTFATTEQKFGSNPAEKHAYHTTYNDVDITFIITEDSITYGDNLLTPRPVGAKGLKEKRLFDDWMDYINPIDSYDFQYKNNYQGTISINQYDHRGTNIFSVKLEDAFPISVNQLDLDWSSDGYHKLIVTFAYTRWTTS
jgi:hypothetical protein